nr:helix-turn-helix domain-containing protein [Goodfellowiella coeruleoviolacea]
MMVETGLPLMSARVLTCLFTSDAGSLTAAELVQRLRVSPASVSKGVRYVEGIGLLRRERDPGSRRERYVLDDDVWYRAWLSSSRSLTRWAATTEHGADVLGHATPAGARLDTTTRFFRFAVDALTQLAEHWRQTFAPETRPVAESRAEPPR